MKEGVHQQQGHLR